MKNLLTRTGTVLVSKRGAWLVLAALVLLVTVLFGLLSGAGEDRPTQSAPPDSESARAEAVLDQFPGANEQ
ncbi:hypothetical protein KCW65_22070, partial [Mycobacterium tuberculosis]|nr:hypothetical protein [Mycobacterium tuberculosis]